MLDLPLGFAFSAGAVAAFNPCGFALLPAYLSLFLSSDDPSRASGLSAVRRGVVVAATVAAGFTLVFGVAGLLISQTAVTVQRFTPWLSVVIGLAMIPLGIAIMRGWQPKLRLPRLTRKGPVDGTLGSMFSFGVSYAVVSLSCTIPAFLVSVSTTFESADLLSGLAVFAAYTAGMTAVLGVLTVAVAAARQGAVSRMRKVVRFIGPVSGLLAVLAGAYVAYYGWYEIRLEQGGSVPTGPVDAVGRVSGAVTTWVADLGRPVVLVMGALLIAAVAVSLVRGRRASGVEHQT